MIKRKTNAHRPSSAAKKLKVQHGSLDTLPWRSVARPVETGLDGDDCILELDEVDNVEVVYEEKDGGKFIKFNTLQVPDITAVGESPAADREPPFTPPDDPQPPTTVSFDVALLPKWSQFNLHPHLLQVLHNKLFTTPTPIQLRALPFALSDRDVIGIAETGSGKTLAYGLPILHRILSQPRCSAPKRSLQALIIAPTRELALQVSDHLGTFSKTFDPELKQEPQEIDLSEAQAWPSTKGKEPDGKGAHASPLVSVATLVGGMSAQKQRRILDRGVDILIATPGRLWDTLEEDELLARQIRNLKVLVLDEADRMIEAGHFAEMDNILRLTTRRSKGDEIEPKLNGQASTSQNDDMQTFVFSATLSKELQRNLKQRSRPRQGKKGNARLLSTLDDLLLRLDFRDSVPEIIDLSPEGNVVSTLKESKIECLASEKDVYLYYFLLRYPGRSLVFLSAIDGIRRLTPLLELLDLKVFPLHSQLEQRQRLKNLDRFKTTPNAILLATDIAARGLDIPAVDHVIHYQIPRSADSFIHRNGRTARAMNEGFSLLMCSPDERRIVRTLFSSLGRQDVDIPDITIELTLLGHLKERIRLAKQIDVQQHRVKKQNHERSWLKGVAEAMDIELDSDVVSASDDEGRVTRHQRKKMNTQTAAMKAELKEMISRPLIARGISTRYITSGSRPIADDILAGKVHETMLGLTRTDAGSDLVGVCRSRKSSDNAKQEQDAEEWAGIGT